MKWTVFFLFFFLFNTACGVKGRPLPPLQPREIGYGRPQYKGAQKANKAQESEEENKKQKGNP